MGSKQAIAAQHLLRKAQSVARRETLPPDLLTRGAVESRFIGSTGFPEAADSVAYEPTQGLLAVRGPSWGRTRGRSLPPPPPPCWLAPLLLIAANTALRLSGPAPHVYSPAMHAAVLCCRPAALRMPLCLTPACCAVPRQLPWAPWLFVLVFDCPYPPAYLLDFACTISP